MPGSATPARSRRDLALYAAATLGLGAGLLLHRRFFHDDAFITLRYADRLLAGRGLTWNDGERVEGFSSPLWLGQAALLMQLGLSGETAVRLLGLGYATGILALWYRGRGNPAALLALVTVPGFALWTWGGLETIAAGFWACLALRLVSAMANGILRPMQTAWLAAALAATALARPEGFAVGLGILAGGWAVRGRRELALATGCFAVAWVGYQGFRLWYFGDFVANAARAKALGLPIGSRVADALTYLGKTSPQWLGSVLLAAWLLATSPQPGRALRLLGPLLPSLAAVFMAGGDHMPGARLLMVPIATLALAASLAPRSPRAAHGRTAVGLAILVAVWQLQQSARFPAARNPAAAIGEVVGRALERQLPKGSLVAAATAGSLPYFAPSLSFIDTLGLNDRHIAHSPPAPMPSSLATLDNWLGIPGHTRGDGAYVLARRPDVVILGGANGDRAPWFLGDYQIAMLRGFQMDYAPWRLLIDASAAARADLADELDETGERLPVTFYVRRDSPVWSIATAAATPLRAPWDETQ